MCVTDYKPTVTTTAGTTTVAWPTNPLYEKGKSILVDLNIEVSSAACKDYDKVAAFKSGDYYPLFDPSKKDHACGTYGDMSLNS